MFRIVNFFLFFPLLLYAVPKPPDSLPISLVEQLGSEKYLRQTEAMAKLDRLGKKAVPFLLKYINTDNESQRWRVWYLLARRGRKEVIPFLKKGIQSELKRGGTRPYLGIYFYSLAHFPDLDEITFILNHLPIDSKYFGEAVLYKMAKKNRKGFLKGLYLKKNTELIKTHEVKKVLHRLVQN